MRKMFSIQVICGIVVLVIFCSALITSTPTPLAFKIPKGWPKPEKDFLAENSLTQEGFELGRKIFYDQRLSKDGLTSCGNCHQQFASFATLDHDLSHGVNNSFTNRNAPALINLAWNTSFHWDGSIHHIEAQPLAPFTMPNEMGETQENIVNKIKADTAYIAAFVKAFGSAEISMPRITKALAQFTINLVSSNSKYDSVMRGEAKFLPAEERGYALFKTNCGSCHREPLFTDNSFRNNGQGINRLADIGRGAITQLGNDSLKFKVPTLRNVQVSFPYMHDGSVMYLPNVIGHYVSLDTSNHSLDPLLKKKIILSEREKKELMYFLYTLTDNSFLKDKRFAPPVEIKYVH